MGFTIISITRIHFRNHKTSMIFSCACSFFVCFKWNTEMSVAERIVRPPCETSQRTPRKRTCQDLEQHNVRHRTINKWYVSLSLSLYTYIYIYNYTSTYTNTYLHYNALYIYIYIYESNTTIKQTTCQDLGGVAEIPKVIHQIWIGPREPPPTSYYIILYHIISYSIILCHIIHQGD